jgi:hypothetical protein
MLLKARQKPAQRFKRIEFSGALKYVLFCIYMFIYDVSFDFVTQSKHSKRLHSSGVLVHPLAVRRSPTDECFVVFRTCSVVRFCWVILLCTMCAVFMCVHVCGIGSISPRPLCSFRAGEGVR